MKTRNDFKFLYVTANYKMTDKLSDFRFLCRASANKYARGSAIKLAINGIEFEKWDSDGYWTTDCVDTIEQHFVEKIEIPIRIGR